LLILLLVGVLDRIVRNAFLRGDDTASRRPVNLQSTQPHPDDLVYSWENIDIVGQFQRTDGEPSYNDTAMVRSTMTPAQQIVAWWRVVSDCRGGTGLSYCAPLAVDSYRTDVEPQFQQQYPVVLPDMAEGINSCDCCAAAQYKRRAI
jgi:hypothetical protein